MTSSFSITVLAVCSITSAAAFAASTETSSRGDIAGDGWDWCKTGMINPFKLLFGPLAAAEGREYERLINLEAGAEVLEFVAVE